MSAITSPPSNKKSLAKTLKSQWQLLLMSVPMLLYAILFSYTPLLGWVLAFQVWRPRIGLGTFQQFRQNEWVGFENFRQLLDQGQFMGRQFRLAVENTIAQSLLILIFGTIGAIVLSLMLHEVRQLGVKRIIQNILYLPHFLSWIIVTGLASVALALPVSGGFINEALLTLRIINEPIHFLAHPQYFWGIVAGTHLWKNLGWNTILYMAAMTAIDPALYEAASIDGASRYRKMWHVTLPCIRPTIVILLIMSVGWLLTSGFEVQWFLGRGVNLPRSENLDTFILRYGIIDNNFGLATAAGIIRTGLSIALLTGANFIARRLGEESLF